MAIRTIKSNINGHWDNRLSRYVYLKFDYQIFSSQKREYYFIHFLIQSTIFLKIFLERCFRLMFNRVNLVLKVVSRAEDGVVILTLFSNSGFIKGIFMILEFDPKVTPSPSKNPGYGTGGGVSLDPLRKSASSPRCVNIYAW